MCGIHLIWGKGANEESIGTLMKDAQHRGPDQDARVSPWPGIWIGANRLKILHPGPEADQPFWSTEGNHLLVWNGEIYNFQDLRNLLLKMGIDLFTQSDTEVLMHWLKIFGSAGLEKLRECFLYFLLDLTIPKCASRQRSQWGKATLLSSDSRKLDFVFRISGNCQINPVRL
jgi:Asparagine synthase (glutamine-hydrolyzing)